MRPTSPPPHAIRFAIVIASLCALCTLGSLCGPDQSVFWVCLDPVTGKESATIFDSNHVVNGQPDPCHCFDPCGPQKTCPIVVDAGPLPSGCDAGHPGDAGDGG